MSEEATKGLFLLVGDWRVPSYGRFCGAKDGVLSGGKSEELKLIVADNPETPRKEWRTKAGPMCRGGTGAFVMLDPVPAGIVPDLGIGAHADVAGFVALTRGTAASAAVLDTNLGRACGAGLA